MLTIISRYRGCPPAPASDSGRDVEEELEGELHLLGDLPEVLAALALRPVEEVFDEPDANVVAHLLELQSAHSSSKLGEIVIGGRHICPKYSFNKNWNLMN